MKALLCVQCNVVWQQVINSIWTPAWDWVNRAWRTCSRRKCKWWCACCNKWLCWIAVIFVAILVVILTLVVLLLAIVKCVLCNIFCFIGCRIGTLVPGTGEFEKCFDDCMKKRDEDDDSDDSTTVPLGDTGSGGPTGPGGGGPPPPPGGVADRESRDARASSTTTTLSTMEDLEDATRWWRLLAIANPTYLELPGLNQEQSTLAQSISARLSAACGCREGEAGALVGVSLFALLWFTGALPVGGIAALVVSGVSFAISGGLIGKIVGLLWAQRSLARLIRKLQSSLAAA